MVYFMSDIHGHAEAYFAMKDEIEFSEEDELYVLGDIFDRNTEHPEACLKILDDIMEHDNITLILGEHEYVHVMYQCSQGEERIMWKDRLFDESIGGKELAHYINSLSEAVRDKYIKYLISCEVSMLKEIAGRYVYMVHGAPSVCKKDEINWQKAVVRNRIDLKSDYSEAIMSDAKSVFLQKEGVDAKDVLIVCGHCPAYMMARNDDACRREYDKGDKRSYQRVLYWNNRLLLDCGCQADEYMWTSIPTLACVAMDETGFTTKYLSNLY